MCKFTFFWLAIVVVCVPASGRDFLILRSGTPFPGEPTMPRVRLVTGGAFFRKVSGKYDFSAPDPDIITQFLASARLRESLLRNELIVLDVECWNMKTDDPQELKRNSENLIYIVDRFHKAAPGAAIGFYGIVPRRDYFAPLRGLEARIAPESPKSRAAREAMRKWEQSAQRLAENPLHDERPWQGLLDRVDILFPSLYDFYGRTDEWVVYAQGMLELTRSFNKRFFAYISPNLQQTASDGTVHPFCTKQHFYTMLRTCQMLGADGVVIHAYPPNPRKSRDIPAWDESWGWVQGLRQFEESFP